MSIPNNYYTYLNIAKQLLQFIRDEDSYQTFVYFLQAYYQWLGLDFNIEDLSKNLLNYADIDNTLPAFEQFFFNQFLQYFPQECLTDKRKLVRFSKEFYQRKSTPSAFKFLFRALYNSECDTTETKDFVLVASGGKWASSKSIKINSVDPKFLKTVNYKVLGLSSFAVGKIERTRYFGNKIELFLSDLTKQFQSGEIVKVVDNFLNDIYDEDGNNLSNELVAKIVSPIQKIIVDPNRRGSNYVVNDPVVFSGGLNPDIENSKEAVAIVDKVSLGALKQIHVVEGSQGFRLPANSEVVFIGGGGTGASASVSVLDASNPFEVTNIVLDVIKPYSNVAVSNTTYQFPHFPSANANTKLIDAFSTTSFTTYPIVAVSLTSGGTNYTEVPGVNVLSTYIDVNGDKENLADLNILGKIQIINGGQDYVENDTIVFTGGSGAGAYANVTSVDVNGAIEEIQYVENYLTNEIYPIGGVGYSTIPSLSVNSSLGNGADLRILSVLGDGEKLSIKSDKIGEILSVKVIDGGENYISNPLVSLRVQDIIVSGVNVLDLPQKDSEIYQGVVTNPSFRAKIKEFTKITDTIFQIRLYNYVSNINSTLPLKLDKNSVGDGYYQYTLDSTYNTHPFSNGIKLYGDGLAVANSEILSGVTFYKGRYLDSDSHLSSYSKLQNDVYNNYTYLLSVQKSFSEYKEVLFNLLHPAGSQVIAKNVIKNEQDYKYEVKDSETLKIIHLNDLLSRNQLGNSFHSTISTSDIRSGNAISFTDIIRGSLDDCMSSNGYLKFVNDVYSVNELTLLVKSDSNYIPTKGKFVYQGDVGSPTFSGTIEISEEYSQVYFDYPIYKIFFSDYSGKLDNSGIIYSDGSVTGDKSYVYSIETLTEYPFVDGIYSVKNNDVFYAKITSIADSSITLETNKIMKYANVAYGYTSGNSFIISSLTNKFDYINNGYYSTENHFKDIAFIGDTISTSNIGNSTILNIDYDNRIIYFNNTLNNSGNVTNPTLLTVTRNLSYANVYYYADKLDRVNYSEYYQIQIETGEILAIDEIGIANGAIILAPINRKYNVDSFYI